MGNNPHSWKGLLPPDVTIHDARRSRLAEGAEQEKLFSLVRLYALRYKRLNFLFHTANEGTGSARRGARLKRQGVVSGVWDISSDSPSADYRFDRLRIEMKTRYTSLSENQIEWAHYYQDLGKSRLAVCYSADDAWEVVKEYFGVVEEGL